MPDVKNSYGDPYYGPVLTVGEFNIHVHTDYALSTDLTEHVEGHGDYATITDLDVHAANTDLHAGGNIDGGTFTSVYGGTDPIDGGTL